MRVNPPNSAAVDLVMPDELNDFRVCDQGRLAHHFVLGKKLCVRTAVTDQQLPINEIVTEHFMAGLAQGRPHLRPVAIRSALCRADEETSFREITTCQVERTVSDVLSLGRL